MSGMGITSNSTIENFRNVNGPLLDIRSPKEFNQGHLPGAINLPLFSNEERAAVGTTYKKQGRNKAILLGLKFTGPKLLSLKKSLENHKVNYEINTKLTNESSLRLYCWRGGMRSASIAWLADLLDLKPVVLKGGYKAYRQWVLKQFEKEWPLKLVAGRTGTGKTDLLLSLVKKGFSVIDLEGLANHRGSSFGALGLPTQPSTEHYENLLAEALEMCSANEPSGIWLEAESSNLGRCRIPQSLFSQMKKAPVVEISRSLNERVQQLVDVYGHQGKEALQEATLRISRRLGPQRTNQAISAISKGQWNLACMAMLDYYDRCYDYELERSPKRQTVDISGLSPDLAAEKLIALGLVENQPFTTVDISNS